MVFHPWGQSLHIFLFLLWHNHLKNLISEQSEQMTDRTDSGDDIVWFNHALNCSLTSARIGKWLWWMKFPLVFSTAQILKWPWVTDTEQPYLLIFIGRLLLKKVDPRVATGIGGCESWCFYFFLLCNMFFWVGLQNLGFYSLVNILHRPLTITSSHAKQTRAPISTESN